MQYVDVAVACLVSTFCLDLLSFIQWCFDFTILGSCAVFPVELAVFVQMIWSIPIWCRFTVVYSALSCGPSVAVCQVEFHVLLTGAQSAVSAGTCIAFRRQFVRS